MRLKSLFEAKYAGQDKPRFQGLSAEKIMEKFFWFDEELTQTFDGEGEIGNKFYQVHGGIHVEDDNGETITNLIVHPDGQIFTVDHGTGDDWKVDPSKFLVYQTRILHKP